LKQLSEPGLLCLNDIMLSARIHDRFGADTRMIHLREEAPPPFHFLIPQKEDLRVGLGTLLLRRQRETVRLQGTFPVSRGLVLSKKSIRRLKHSWSRTLLLRHAGEGRATCQMAQCPLLLQERAVMHRAVKPKLVPLSEKQNCGGAQMQAPCLQAGVSDTRFVQN
jgi:hypothetical protein